LIALIVWTFLLVSLELFWILGNMIENGEISLTMVFGSMIAGGTSLGAVAFPVLTKVLSVSPYQAKVFALAIQTIDMGAASMTIIAMETKGARLEAALKQAKSQVAIAYVKLAQVKETY
jgi:uncharacterized protein